MRTHLEDLSHQLEALFGSAWPGYAAGPAAACPAEPPAPAPELSAASFETLGDYLISLANVTPACELPKLQHHVQWCSSHAEALYADQVSKEVKKAVKSGGYEAEFSLRVHSLCLRLQNDGQVKDVLSKSVEVLAAGKKAQKAFLKGQLDSMPIPSAPTMTRVRLSLDLAHMRLRRRAHSDMDYLQNACRNVFLDSSPMKGWDWLRVVVCKPLQGASKTKKNWLNSSYTEVRQDNLLKVGDAL